MNNSSRKIQAMFGDNLGIDEGVLDTHQKYLRDHPYVEKYDSAGDYFENEVGLPNVAEEYYEMPVYSASRIHSYAQRDYLLLQKNPDIPINWIESNVHWSYEDLTGDLVESVRINLLQTSKTITRYFNDTDTVRLGLKCIIDAVQSNLDCDFEGNAISQSDYEDYLQLSEARAYCGDRKGNGADLTAGFHNDFAYTNRCKFQTRGSAANPSTVDDEWLADELSVINPKVVFALGQSAYQGLRNIGFEKTGERSQYSDGKTGRVLKYTGEHSNLNGTYAVHLYHLDYRQTLNTDRDIHDAVSTVSRGLNSQ